MRFVPVPRDVDELTPVSQCLHHWRGSDLELATVDGRVGTLTRALDLGVDDINNATAFTTGYHQPSWENIQAWPINGVFEESMMLRLGAADKFTFDVDFLPQALGFYHEFVAGNPLPTSGLALWSITNDAVSGARLLVDSTGTYYRLRHHNGSTEITCTLAAAPAIGDRVRMYGFLNANGSIQLWQSINEAAFTTASNASANALASGWGSGAKLRYCGSGTSTGATVWNGCSN